MAEWVRSEQRDGVVEVIVNHPPLNVLSVDVLEQLSAALADLGPARVMLLRAEGRCFSAGADVREHLPDLADDMLTAMRRVLERLLLLDVPSVVAVHGDARGGGLELVAACDLAVAAVDARLGQPEILLGCFAPFAAALLPPLVGRRRAAELLLSGEAVSGQQAQAMGLVNHACAADQVIHQARARAEQLAGLSAVALRAARMALRAAEPSDLVASLAAAESVYRAQSLPTEDYREGLEAFLEKRPAIWRHR